MIAAPSPEGPRRRWIPGIGVLCASGALAAALGVCVLHGRRAPAARVQAESTDDGVVRSTEGVDGPCPAGMLLVEGGTFPMGSPEGEGEADEHPLRRVTVSSFCIDRHEVTVGDYGVYWERTGRRADAEPDHAPLCNWGHGDRAAHPINCVDWNLARRYCEWSGHPGGARRLPTEAQWEFAARGREGRIYPWGNLLPGARACWSGLLPRTTTCAVGTHAAGATPTGIHDLAGNVWEWTADRWSPSYDPASLRDPEGSTVDSGQRVFRGGAAVVSVASALRTASRGRNAEAMRSRAVGVRCVQGPR